MIEPLRIIGHLLPWIAVGAVAGWVAGVCVWLWDIPPHDTMRVEYGLASVLVAAIVPVAVPIARYWSFPSVRSAILKCGGVGVFFGFATTPVVTGMQVGPTVQELLVNPLEAYTPTWMILVTCAFILIGVPLLDWFEESPTHEAPGPNEGNKAATDSGGVENQRHH